LGQARGVGDDLHLRNLTVRNRKPEHALQTPVRRQDDPQFSVDERRLREAHGLRKSDYALAPSDCAFGPGTRAASLSRGAWTRACFVNANNHVWIEHGDESFDVSGAEGRKESVDQRALLRAKRGGVTDKKRGKRRL
jgi:hypothetical protein